MVKAQCELMAEGKPYPRSCPVCGLGPCQRSPVEISSPASDGKTDWRKTAFELWRLLDDIDTADDIAKKNDDWYRRRVRYLHKLRFTHLSGPNLQAVYMEYYPADGVMPHNGPPQDREQ